KGPANFATM
nr:Chain I, Glycoprotein G1 [Lymphocytic choriomeningitis virus (strain WE)]3TBV_J Chain J, Glycoprotein G1 [Lymphocytic choriomeningitis virus (strain WE)]3TBV_K Chain K, Glycoprotein G1 [Lymphocytic choriomeningitis virus (strain WE)]3TBV_L Chain L, Glycoprotein G1 [Lymphocytic choriomeningitis virus (strain WE)]